MTVGTQIKKGMGEVDGVLKEEGDHSYLIGALIPDSRSSRNLVAVLIFSLKHGIPTLGH